MNSVEFISIKIQAIKDVFAIVDVKVLNYTHETQRDL
jgi:hypothetical protein